MKNYPIVLALLCVAYFSSCSQGKKAPVEEDYQVRIAVDETFRPIIEEEMNTTEISTIKGVEFGF